MAKYLLLKHYRGGKTPTNDVPSDEWTPEEWEAHMAYMIDFERRLIASGEFVASEALAMDGVWVRYDGEGRPPVTDGPFAETKDLVAGWMLFDVDSYDRALAVAAELSAAPAAGGKPLGEWLELRPVMEPTPAITE
ncbi:YciI family protein [Microbacterium sp. 2FI]|uniref:YciI family protein n=1 Tax=Microbacterium sp. 2FI TaxID=2502193 RepID=UPI0010F64CB4|nr:YciI family protein [Microbacterium sp. 2FI]